MSSAASVRFDGAGPQHARPPVPGGTAVHQRGGPGQGSGLELRTWRSSVEEIGLLLERVHGDAAAARADARWLARHVAGGSAADWWLRFDSSPAAHQRRRLRSLVSQRLAGQPVAYLVGTWPFRSLELEVGPGVLVPRPETEQVVDVALERLGPLCDGPLRRPLVADLGTGTGAIALGIVTDLPAVTCWAVESEADALGWARRNLDRHPAVSSRVRLCQGQWYRGLPRDLLGRLDMIVSNPPYLSEDEYRSLRCRLGGEPVSALVGGQDGMSCVEDILGGASSWLRPGGALVMEVAEHRAGSVADEALAQGASSTLVYPDLAGRPRVVVAEW